MSKYTAEEQDILNEMAQNRAMDVDKVANFLVSHKGDMSLNRKLRRDLEVDNHLPDARLDKMNDKVRGNKEMLTYYMFKTRSYDKGVASLQKLNLAKEQKEAGIEVEEFEKPNLQEIGQVAAIASIYGKGESWRDDEFDVLKFVAENTKVDAFKEIYQAARDSTTTLNDLETQAVDARQYRSGDLMMSLTSKHAALQGKKPKMLGHGGRVEEKILNKYLHAAPVYIDHSNPNDPIATKSDVFSSLRSDEVELNEILDSNSFRIDPTKLVSKKHAALLEKIDYGHKLDGEGKPQLDEQGAPLKATWQEVIRERYEILSHALHIGQLPSKIKALEDLSEALEEEAYGMSTPESEKLDKQITELEDRLISNDGKRLADPRKWIMPALSSTIGNTQWFEQNKHRELSKKMFSATQDQKKMICSEFAARSIAATVDQLGRLTSMDLEAKGLIAKEEKIVRNPIPVREDFNKLHPERLVNLLKKSRCVEQIYNPALTAIIQTESTSRTKSANFMENLPKKLYSVMQGAKNADDFKEKAENITKVYLKQLKIDPEVVSKVMPQVTSSLDDLYTQKNKVPRTLKEKIGKICIKILEFCKLRTKDKFIKDALSKATMTISNQATEKQSTHLQRIDKQRVVLAAAVSVRGSVTDV